MFDQIFLSLHAKGIMIISNKHGTHNVPHELPNDLGNVRKISKLHRIIA